MDTSERIAFIRNMLGDQAAGILRGYGINVDDAITRVVIEQDRAREARELQAAHPSLGDFMTSELVYKSASIEDPLGREYVRRMTSIGFDNTKAASLYAVELVVLSGDLQREQRQQPWATRYFFANGFKLEHLPKKEQVSMSEMVLITDDAESAYFRDHHSLDPDAWHAVCYAAISAIAMGGAQYAYALRARVEALGWTRPQENAFTRNESLLTERLKWGKHENPAWTPATTAITL